MQNIVFIRTYIHGTTWKEKCKWINYTIGFEVATIHRYANCVWYNCVSSNAYLFLFWREEKKNMTKSNELNSKVNWEKNAYTYAAKTCVCRKSSVNQLLLFWWISLFKTFNQPKVMLLHIKHIDRGALPLFGHFFLFMKKRKKIKSLALAMWLVLFLINYLIVFFSFCFRSKLQLTFN